MKFKVGDKVRVVKSDDAYGLYTGSVHTVVSVHPMGNIELQGISTILWLDDRFELVQEGAVLTPEEVFKHLRKGTKLQQLTRISKQWVDVIHPEHTPFENICNIQWRIKPEPEVIELNGKKYREIVD